jgi:hypothetical protein
MRTLPAMHISRGARLARPLGQVSTGRQPLRQICLARLGPLGHHLSAGGPGIPRLVRGLLRAVLRPASDQNVPAPPRQRDDTRQENTPTHEPPLRGGGYTSPPILRS